MFFCYRSCYHRDLDLLTHCFPTRLSADLPFALAATARVTQQDDSVTVRLERAEGRAFGQSLALRGPATVTHGPTETRIDGLALTSGEASLIAEAALGADRLMLDASLESVPLAVLDAFWDSGLGGQLSADRKSTRLNSSH